jgi:hypothetical protein
MTDSNTLNEMETTARRMLGFLAERHELLAALRDAEVALQHSVAQCDHYPEPQSRHFSALLRVRAAIAKAEGR